MPATVRTSTVTVAPMPGIALRTETQDGAPFKKSTAGKRRVISPPVGRGASRTAVKSADLAGGSITAISSAAAPALVAHPTRLLAQSRQAVASTVKSVSSELALIV